MKLRYAFVMPMLAFLAGCAQTEKTEAVTAEITAAQMEGRNAARRIISKNWKDTIELQKELLDIKARQSKYIIEKKEKCAAAFDSSFFSTIRTVNPDLNKIIRAH